MCETVFMGINSIMEVILFFNLTLFSSSGWPFRSVMLQLPFQSETFMSIEERKCNWLPSFT